jgi:PAS fold
MHCTKYSITAIISSQGTLDYYTNITCSNTVMYYVFFALVHRYVYKLFDIPPDDPAIGTPAEDAIYYARMHPDDLQYVSDAFLAVASGKHEGTFETVFRVVHRDGTVVHLMNTMDLHKNADGTSR